MRYKKIILLSFFIIVASCVILLVYFQPKPLIKDINSCNISNILYKEKEITDKDKQKRILELLTSYKTRETFERIDSYLIEDVVIEINGTDNRKPFHIVLGEECFKYEHAEGFKQNIIHGDNLLNAIVDVLLNS